MNLTHVWKDQRWRRVQSLALLLFLACGEKASSPAGDMVAKVEDEIIRRGELEAFFRDHSGEAEESPLDDTLRSRLFDRYLDERMLQRLALERGFIPTAEGSIDSRQVLTYLVRTARARSVTDEAVQAWYTTHADEYRRNDEVHLRQILVLERDVAEQALAQLRLGEDFALVAAQFSQGPMAQNDGDQGRLSRDDLPPEFTETIFGLEPGEVSEVVEADYGFHIFQVIAHYPAETISLEAAAPEIRREIWRQQADRQVEDFFQEARERYNVQIFTHNLPFEYRGHHAT